MISISLGEPTLPDGANNPAYDQLCPVFFRQSEEQLASDRAFLIELINFVGEIPPSEELEAAHQALVKANSKAPNLQALYL
ncbi:hypothetical protein QTI17_31200 [Variovorax sp. J31P179]|uniref:hypothetical protein n=1 Tax=Variovorax sp. J31P179 TaxID=3053508 RepID=UPI0025771172|nr:hypothetical protein [Variovorax sp. J31P179]MDM0085064.1 hypothetical protein [Variovorax sp. J31P179]